MHRPRDRAAVLNERPPLRQPWVPRVVNGALALFLAAFVAPIVTNLGDKRWYVQVVLLAMTALVLLFVVLCLSSALRPGSLGRFVRRQRGRRGSRSSGS